MSTHHPAIESAVRDALRDHGRLVVDPYAIDVRANLYEGGMTSHASVNVMMTLEGRFDLEFPNAMLTRDVFSTIEGIASALATLGVQA
ncbi:MAG: acyl carrier protein [Aquabacterium sp.]|nr:acyl carrier protein [Aquabacterium sp.]